EKKDLESLEESLTEQKKVVFVKLFRDINLHMNSIYYNLSDGGEAMLVMSDEQNPLESEILIRAKPKGSNFNKIDSLSGGEKSLTAMAFIMAVQRINPSPIYYLDEVDMFLDGANAEHIGRMMKENSKSSQVLIVSLRKAMLKYSDQIIGVTTFDDENTDIFVKSFSEVKA
ncbi:MAG: AAA family ATPase, partial [Candidatus Thermoplasmatota archaeon]|nr:AAA family ATPase [Candidatus Thermoplasmatota archaeon]